MNADAYVGFQFSLPDGPHDFTSHAGWARVRLDTSGAFAEFIIQEWAYESVSGSSITIGTVPEPSATALGLVALAAGAAGLRRWRKARPQS